MATTQGVKLDDDTRVRLKALAEKRKRSPHWLMKAAIEDYLEREERYEAEKAEDMAAYEEHLRSGETIDNAVVVSWLNDLANNKPSSWRK